MTHNYSRRQNNRRFSSSGIDGESSTGQLFQDIQRLVHESRYLIGQHAAERLEERGIMEWQAVAGLATGKEILERSKAFPNPVVEVREILPDGTEFKAVWSHLRQIDVAKLVTIYFLIRNSHEN